MKKFFFCLFLFSLFSYFPLPVYADSCPTIVKISPSNTTDHSDITDHDHAAIEIDPQGLLDPNIAIVLDHLSPSLPVVPKGAKHFAYINITLQPGKHELKALVTTTGISSSGTHVAQQECPLGTFDVTAQAKGVILPNQCPVCKDGSIWNESQKTCQDKKDTASYSDPTLIEDCGGGATCTPGTGCVASESTEPAAPGLICPNGSIKNPNTDKASCTLYDSVINIDTTPAGFIKTLLSLLLSLGGGIALLLIIIAGYQMVTSQGNPEKLQEARGRITSAIVGLLLIIFSLVLLQIISIDILHIPGFK